ncbi:hypothetical protein [Acinetobacter pragensis]|uniref:hypothetical protein n=1 Tax=Acinetobacter pragensis TaxID=1806892 RepID=UPI003341BFBB
MKSIYLNFAAVILTAGFASAPSWATKIETATESAPAVSMDETVLEADVRPLSKEELQQGLSELRERQNQRIEDWGQTLKPEDFERSWFGRILKKPKRQEVCGIYQSSVDETLKLAQQNQNRLPEADQKLLSDRNAFIQSLGYKNNIVDTRMGFNCRIR